MSSQYPPQTRTAGNGCSGIPTIMEKCTNCGKDVLRTFWTRLFPNSQFCKECWNLPDQEKVAIIRSTIAHTLAAARKHSRTVARIMRDSMRGTGVPTNPRRTKRG